MVPIRDSRHNTRTEDPLDDEYDRGEIGTSAPSIRRLGALGAVVRARRLSRRARVQHGRPGGLHWSCPGQLS